VVKRIVVLSDGTGNSAAKVWRTNIWRLFDSIDQTETEQVAFYDDGIGTSSFKPFAIFGGMFGYGLKRNVIECYKFLCRNYEPDAEIFAFGFSRGAFTIRVLIEIVTTQGLVSYQGSERELHSLALAAYRAYRKTLSTYTRVEAPFRLLRDFVVGTPYRRLENQHIPNFRFVGLWDTVAAYGLPIEEMTRVISWFVFPLELPSARLPIQVETARHALALDEERRTFRPMLLEEDPNDPDRVSQVWFAGVHANVGGGYPDDSLAHISLSWMMDESSRCGLRFKAPPKSDPDSVRQINTKRQIDGRLYDSRSGIAGYYRYGPRDLTDIYESISASEPKSIPKIHHSVFDRLRRPVHPYAPKGLPRRYVVVDQKGKVLELDQNPYEHPTQAAIRFELQDRVWNRVFVRSLAYLLVVAVTSAFFLFPFLRHSRPSDESTSHLRAISDLIRIAGAFLPSFLDFWVNAYARNPAIFLVGLIFLIYFQMLNSRLKVEISDEMRAIWRATSEGKMPPPENSFLFRLRKSRVRLFFRRALLGIIIPVIVMFAVLSWGLMFASHLLFNLGDAAGLYCSSPAEKSGSDKKFVAGNGWQSTSTPFDVSKICWDSGFWLKADTSYRIEVTQIDDWFDDVIPTSIAGFETFEVADHMRRVAVTFGFPLRRDLDRPFFSVIARIGSVGSEENFLDPDPSKSQPRQVVQTIRSNREGELFLYVNDAVLPIPGLADFFYRNNRGSALVRIKELG
jgi:uncharacterized protein (DUF2235 family)